MTSQARRFKTFVVKGTGTIFGEMADITPPGASIEKLDNTSQNNFQGWTTTQPGWKDATTLTFKINDYGGAEQASIYSYLGSVDNWLVVYGNAPGSTATGPIRADSFSGYISDIKPAAPMKGAVATFAITVEVAGAITPITTIAGGLTTPWISMTNQTATSIPLSPTAAATIYEYTGTSALADTGVKITPTAAVGTIIVNGTIVATGVASGVISINPAVSGALTVIPIVVMETNKVPKIYWITVIQGSV